MHLIWTATTRKRREAIFDYIAADNPKAALWLDKRFSEGTKQLLIMPNMGRHGRVPGTRELVVHENYILVYEVRVDTIVILAIHHSARNYPLA